MRTASTASLRAVVLSAAVLATLHGGSARAQADAAPAASEEAKARARTYATQAFQALDRGDYAGALRGFSLAIQSYDAPTLRVGRGAALEGLGRLSEAAEDYRMAATSVPVAGEPEAFARARAEAGEKAKAIEARLQSAPPAAAEADSPATPDSGVAAQPPAESADGVNEPSSPLQPVPWAASNDSSAPVSEVVANAEPPGAAEEERDTGATVALGTITIALGVGTLITGVLFLTTKSEFDDVNGSDRGEAESLRSRAKTLAWVNTGLFLGTLTTGFCTLMVWPDSAPAAATGKHPFDLARLQVGVGGAF